MAYCLYTDVQKIIKWTTFSATSKVTTSDITNFFIPEADAYIDAKLERVYVVPITDSDDITILFSENS